MLYALYVGCVSVFSAIAALGHALVLVAIYPDMFGLPPDGLASELGGEQAPPERPRIA